MKFLCFIGKKIKRIVLVFIKILINDSPVSLSIQTRASYLNFGSDEEARDANELQRWLEDVSLCGHEAIEVVLGQVVRLPVQFVNFTHLRWEHNNLFIALEQIISPVNSLNHNWQKKKMVRNLHYEISNTRLKKLEYRPPWASPGELPSS